VRRSRLVSTLTAVTILGGLCLTAPSALAAPAQPTTDAAASQGSSRHALAVLHRAQAAFGSATATTSPAPFSASGDAARRQRPIDGTMTMLALSRVMPQLRGTDRAAARSILARPTDGTQSDAVSWRASEIAAGQAECSTNVCVNYTTATAFGNAPADVDAKTISPSGTLVAGSNSVPDQVDQTLVTMQHVWDTETGALGYDTPPSDGTAAEPFTPAGSEGKFDVYLSNIGVLGYYGYCAPDLNQRKSSGYCVLDNDYSKAEFCFSATCNSSLEDLQVTAAHEFFHAIQFGYDAWEDTWFMESTAAWMEDEVFPKVNDNLQSLPYGPMHRPGQPVDFISRDYLTSYGPWVFIRYLSNRYGPDVIKAAWTDAIGGASYSLRALSTALQGRHTTFARQFADFEAANAAPATFYDADGARYVKYAVNPTRTISLSDANPTSGWVNSPRVKHTSAYRMAVVPKSAKGHLRVEVRGPIAKSAPEAELVVHLKSGAVTRRFITLTGGVGAARGVPFGHRQIARIDVVLVNASTRYACHVGTSYACGGYPNDDASVFRVRLTRTA
jgi:hypothetical protein